MRVKLEMRAAVGPFVRWSSVRAWSTSTIWR